MLNGNESDFIFEASNGKSNDYRETKFQAELVLMREVNQKTTFYFVRNGTQLSTKEAGFIVDTPLTIYAKGTDGTIILTGAKVKLTVANVETVKFNPSVQVLSTGDDYIEVQLPKGTVYFKK